MATDQQTQLLAAPKEVDVVAIERELVTLWKDARVTDGQTSGNAADSPPVVRACALNFIVVTEDEKEIDALAEMAGEVTLEHPARIFLVVANRRHGTPRLDAWISARCSLPVPGGKQICCEQINLVAEGTEAKKIPSIVTSLLVSDVPSVLLWKGSIDVNDSIVQSLGDVVDRILIDSSEDLVPVPGLHTWRSFIEKRNAHTTFGDLAWTHLTAWRSVVANAFNPPEIRSELVRIDSIMIEYSSTPVPRHSGLSQSLLLAGWLANKLQWSPVYPFRNNGTGEYTAKLRHDEQAINIRVAPVAARTNFPGGIESIAIHMSTGVTVNLHATEHNHCVQFSKHLHDATSDEMLTAMSDKSEAQLVAQELEVVARDAGYEAVLNTLIGLLNAPGHAETINHEPAH